MRSVREIGFAKLAVGAASFAMCVLAYGGELGSTKLWIFNLAAHLRVQVAIALFGLLLLAVLVRCKKSALVCVLGLMPAILPMVYYWPFGVRGTASDTIKIAQVNVNCANRNYDKVVQYIREEDPDLVLIEELTADWEKELTNRLPDYPHRFAEPRPNPQGIGEFSKVPMKNLTRLRLDQSDYPAVIFDINHGSRTLSVIHVHLTGPMSSRQYSAQNSEMRELAKLAGSKPHPLLVAGDFNATPWSRQFQGLLQSTGLQTTCTTGGYHTTWPAAVPKHTDIKLPSGGISVSWRIPIDQFLITDRMALIKQSVGPYVGSDHYPLTAQFAVP